MKTGYLYAWALLSIYYSTNFLGKAKLKKIIISGDMINHAIFSRGELEKSLKGLVLNGFIVLDKKNVSLTIKGKRLLKSAINKTRYPTEQLKLLSETHGFQDDEVFNSDDSDDFLIADFLNG